MDDNDLDAILESVLGEFLAAHPSYHAMYRVTLAGDVEIQPALFRAMTWWLRREGRITQEQAMRLETYNREVEHGQKPWLREP